MVHVKKVHFLQFLVSRPDIVEGPFSQGESTLYKVKCFQKCPSKVEKVECPRKGPREGCF